MKKLLIALAAVTILVVTVLIVLVFRPSQPENSLRIGIILPLTGPSAFIGESTRKGLDLALEQHNAAGNHPPIELLYEDSAGDVKQAVATRLKERFIRHVNSTLSPPLLLLFRPSCPPLSRGTAHPQFSSRSSVTTRLAC